MGSDKLEKLFNPASIAVFGASESSHSVGAMVYRNLVSGSFQRRLFPINPKYKKIGNSTCFPSIDKIGNPVDLAIIATPAATVPKILVQCGKAGIKNAIILSAGFGESGEDGQRLNAKLQQTAKQYGIKFIGPNCVGLVRPWLSMDASFLRSKTPKGNLALISQSGALCSAISDWAEPHDLGFSALVSLGNSTNTGFGDVLKFLATDPKTEAILVYVEGIRFARSFLSSLKLATRLKPVIVLKSGRHAKSLKAARTHTGALTGSDAVFDAALERAGAVRVDTFGQLFAAAEFLSAAKKIRGNRLCIVTNGGGAGVLAADRAGDLNLELPEPSSATIATLDKVLSPYWSKSNPIDILGDAKPAAFGAAVDAALGDDNYDGILVMLTPQAMTDATEAAKAVIEVVSKGSKKPVLACWMGETSVAKARELLSVNGIPDFRVPESAVEAFSYQAKYVRNLKLALEVPGPGANLLKPDLMLTHRIIGDALKEKRTMLSDIESRAIFKAFGIPVNEVVNATTVEDAVKIAGHMGYPVAMKINSPQISHKSDIGGVQLGVPDAHGVTKAFKAITENLKKAVPEAEISGVTIEPMARLKDARELVVGSSCDPIFGPAILFGAGGTMVELLRDSAVSLPPLNTVLANRLINRTKVSRLLDAYRDRPAVDRNAVIGVLLRISDLVCEFPEIEELDINPLLAGPDGVLAIDGRIRVKPVDDRIPRHAHMAIRPYPRHLEKTEYLIDGTKLIIRPIKPEDAQSEHAFVRDLSIKTKQSRFMHTMRELSPEMLVRFTHIDYDREMALIASTEEQGVEVQQGVARYLINADDTSCEFAIVVSDRVQHKGIGTSLMKQLIHAAKAHGLKVIEGTVLANNIAMLHLMRKLDFEITPSIEEHRVMEVSLQI